MEKKLHELFEKCLNALDELRSYAEGMKFTSYGDDKEIAEDIEYSAMSDCDFVEQLCSGGMPSKEEVKKLNGVISYWKEYSEKWDILEDAYLTKVIKDVVKRLENAYQNAAWAVNPRRMASEVGLLGGQSHCFGMMRRARMVTALDDLDFKRFKAIFDGILRRESVDVDAVGRCTGRDYALASVKAQVDFDSGLSDSDKAEIYKAAFKTWSDDVRPVLAKINGFMRGGTWSIMQANSIYGEVQAYEGKKRSSFVLGVLGGVMLAVDDYLKAFANAAETYLTSSFDTIDNSGFQEALEGLRHGVEGGIETLGEDFKQFSGRIKNGIESLRASAIAEAKGDTEGVYRALSAFDRNLDSMRAVGTNFGGLFNVFFGYFIGGSSNESMYDLNRWKQMSKEFKKRFEVIPSALNGMLYAIDKFLREHGMGNVISGSGRDPRAMYRDDAIRCYDSLQSDYINIIRALGNSGVVFDLDEEMSALKVAIDAM